MTHDEAREKMMPCPFCGTPHPYVVTINGRYDNTVGIFCNRCKQTVILEENEEEGDTGETIRRAVAAWNQCWRCEW